MQGVLVVNGCQFQCQWLFRVGQTSRAVGLRDLAEIPSTECFVSRRDFGASRLFPITRLLVHLEAGVEMRSC